MAQNHPTPIFTTTGGLQFRILERELPIDHALEPVLTGINSAQGAVFSSGFDYPGRHSRWDMGFIHPALEFVAKKRTFAINALNEQGRAALKVFHDALSQNPHLEDLQKSDVKIEGKIIPASSYFPEEERSRQPSVFSVLRSLLGYLHAPEPSELGHFGFYGAFGYDLVMQFENILQTQIRDESSSDCHVFFPLEVIIVDRKKEVAKELTLSLSSPLGETHLLPGGGKESPLPKGSGTDGVTCDHAPGEFASKVKKVIEGTKRGDYFEVILSQAFSTRFDDTPTALFQRLAQINPSPYMFLINFGSEQLVGASPEIYIRVTGQRYETCPISGTIPRGASALEDADRVLQLLTSRKDESELTMCSDVDRNDMARVCVPGSVQIIGRRQLEFYSHLIHTVDHLEGKLEESFDALDAFQSHMWACTVTGAPKPAALQEIENFENSPRGWYAGAVGVLCCNGNVNTGITLRTAHIKDGRATTRAGATLLFGSDPDLEEQETRTKAAAFLAAIAGKKQTVPGSKEISSPQEELGNRGRHLRADKKKILLVDYRDSFVHNLAAYLRELGATVVTLRSGFPEDFLDKIKPNLVLLSPGPFTPSEFGMHAFIGKLVQRELPIFGVCLGHQGIGEFYGAKLAQLPEPEHGKSATVTHLDSPLFQGIDSSFEAGRYHSLYLVEDSIPDCLAVTARTVDDSPQNPVRNVVMAIEHKSLPIAGVQFHPESLMSLKKGVGRSLLRNVLCSLAR